MVQTLSSAKREALEERGRTALEEMSRRAIAPVPSAYSVWFTHLSGEDPDLSAALRARDGDAGELDEPGCSELYGRFLSPEAAARVAGQVTSKLQLLLRQLNQQVSGLDKETARYGETLGNARAEVSKARSIADLGDLINEILAETAQMQGSTARLARDLQRQAEQVHTLRTALEAAQREAQHDGLTGISNRRAFDRALRDVALEAEVSGAPACVIMIDVDHFKAFNDRYGHAMGDLVLKQVAALLKASVKGHDTVARYGGEEFAIILPNTTLDDAFTVANKIRWTIASRDVLNRQAKQSLGRVTISAGVSDFQAGESVEEWLERADRALYAAKNEGRNRVVAAAAKPIMRSAKFESGWSKRA